MIKPNRRYKFVKGTVLSTDIYFHEGEEIRTDKDGHVYDKHSNNIIETAILEIWLTNGTLEDCQAFKPKDGHAIYYLGSLTNSDSGVISSITYSTNSHKHLLDAGNVFKDFQDATKALEMVRKTMREFYINI